MLTFENIRALCCLGLQNQVASFGKTVDRFVSFAQNFGQICGEERVSKSASAAASRYHALLNTIKVRQHWLCFTIQCVSADEVALYKTFVCSTVFYLIMLYSDSLLPIECIIPLSQDQSCRWQEYLEEHQTLMDLMTAFEAFSSNFGCRVEGCSAVPGDAESVTKNINVLAELEGTHGYCKGCVERCRHGVKT